LRSQNFSRKIFRIFELLFKRFTYFQKEMPTKTKSPLKYRIRGIFYYVTVALGAIVIAPIYGFFFCKAFKDAKKLNRIAGHFFKPIFHCFGIHLTVKGSENIPKNGGFVILANHQSFLDINVIFAGIYASAFLAKSDLWRIPLFGRALDLNGSIPIYKAGSRKNGEVGFRMKQNMNKGFTYTIFPEGRRSVTGELLPFKDGAFHLAKDYHFTILPITIINAGKVLPKTETALIPGNVEIIVHKPITPKDYETISKEELKENVRKTILSALEAGKAKEA